MALYRAVKDRQEIARIEAHTTRTRAPRTFAIRGKTMEAIKDNLESHGLESEGVMESMRGRKRNRSLSATRKGGDGGEMEDGAEEAPRSRSKSARDRSVSVQSRSKTRGPTSTSVAPHQVKQVIKQGKKEERKMVKYARAGSSDREHFPKLVKHLNSGKRSLGTSTIGR